LLLPRSWVGTGWAYDTIGVHELGEVIGDCSTSIMVGLDTIWDLETFEDWDSVGNTIT
jgi:hypothetical protein